MKAHLLRQYSSRKQLEDDLVRLFRIIAINTQGNCARFGGTTFETQLQKSTASLRNGIEAFVPRRKKVVAQHGLAGRPLRTGDAGRGSYQVGQLGHNLRSADVGLRRK